jgi:hypothetical protein
MNGGLERAVKRFSQALEPADLGSDHAACDREIGVSARAARASRLLSHAGRWR